MLRAVVNWENYSTRRISIHLDEGASRDIVEIRSELARFARWRESEVTEQQVIHLALAMMSIELRQHGSRQTKALVSRRRLKT